MNDSGVIHPVWIGEKINRDPQLRFKRTLAFHQFAGLIGGRNLGDVIRVSNGVRANRHQWIFDQLLKGFPRHFGMGALGIAHKAGVHKHRRRKLVLLQNWESVVKVALIVIIKGQNDRLFGQNLATRQMV